MGREKYTNAPVTTLNGAINDTTTSLTVTDGGDFPTEYFRIIIESEIMFCTSRSGNTLTVERGAEGTTAASHSSGVDVIHGVTAGMLDNYRRDLLAAAGMIDPSDSLSADDDNFDDESFSGWTIVQGTPNCTVTERNHRASVLIPTGTGAQAQFGFMKAKTPSAGDWIQCGIQMGGGAGSAPLPGLIMADGNTYGAGKQAHFGFSINEQRFILRTFTNYNTFSAHSLGAIQLPYFWPTLHMRFQWNSNDNYTCWASADAISWATIFNGTSIGSMAAAPSYVGFAASTWGSANPHVQSFTYVRFNF